MGRETNPIFSPDGQWIAFTGEYDGNVDVYVVAGRRRRAAAADLPPRRRPLVGWTPDGKQVLFVSAARPIRAAPRSCSRCPSTAAARREVPLPMADEGSYSPDGTRLAYVPLPRAFNAWKRYRGGRATPDLDRQPAPIRASRSVPRNNSNDFNPMWSATKVYFLSDRNGPITLFAYDTATKKVAQVLPNNGLDIKSASAGPDAIVYEQFGSLNLFDLKSGKARKVERDGQRRPAVGAPALREGRRPHPQRGALADGARAVFEARGEILTVPAEKGDARNLTNTPGVAERDPAWSPDGKWIAYFSDESGEYALHLRDADRHGRGQEDQPRQPAIVLLLARSGRPTARRSPTPTSG